MGLSTNSMGMELGSSKYFRLADGLALSCFVQGSQLTLCCASVMLRMNNCNNFYTIFKVSLEILVHKYAKEEKKNNEIASGVDRLNLLMHS